MPDPARSTAKNKVLHIAAIIKHQYDSSGRGGFPPLLLILQGKTGTRNQKKKEWIPSFLWIVLINKEIERIIKRFSGWIN
jgi:hypothetical protein